MMHDGIMVFTRKDHGRGDFDVADLDGDMLFFGMEAPKT